MHNYFFHLPLSQFLILFVTALQNNLDREHNVLNSCWYQTTANPASSSIPSPTTSSTWLMTSQLPFHPTHKFSTASVPDSTEIYIAHLKGMSLQAMGE